MEKFFGKKQILLTAIIFTATLIALASPTLAQAEPVQQQENNTPMGEEQANQLIEGVIADRNSIIEDVQKTITETKNRIDYPDTNNFVSEISDFVKTSEQEKATAIKEMKQLTEALTKSPEAIVVDIKQQTITVQNQTINYAQIQQNLAGEKTAQTITATSGITKDISTMGIEFTNDSVSLVTTLPNGDKTITELNTAIKIENQQLYTINENQTTKINMLPTDIYDRVKQTNQNNQIKINIENIKLETEKNNPVYKMQATEDFKLLWLIPMKIQTEYKINAENAEIIEEKKPWYTILGEGTKLKKL
jgi:hypothetical protein